MNPAAPINNRNFLLQIHGAEYRKRQYTLPDNVRVIMACKPIPITADENQRRSLYELICMRGMHTYEKLLTTLNTKRVNMKNVYTNEKLCVYAPGTILNDIMLQASDSGIINRLGDDDYLRREFQNGLFELGINFNSKYYDAGDPRDVKQMAEYISGIFPDSNKYYIHNNVINTADGIITEYKSGYRIRLSEFIESLLQLAPAGFTILLYVCRGGGEDVYEHLPRGVSLQKALTRLKKYRRRGTVGSP